MLRNFIAFISLSLILLNSGCSNTADPEPIRILGSTEISAAVGAEMRVELGLDGGEGTYQFSLSNQPAWLALEYNDNPYRPALILRGIPGLTGGQTTDDLLTIVYSNMLLSVTDGKSVATRNVVIEAATNKFVLEKNTKQEAELEDRPQRSVLNVDLRITEQVDIGMCRVNEAGEPLITEDDMTFWLGLIEKLEAQEAGEEISEADQTELTRVFGAARPRLVYMNLQLASAIVADTSVSFAVDTTGPASSTLTPGEDFLTSVVRANGETLELTAGRLFIPAGESVCPIPLFVNDDRKAEDDEELKVQIQNLSAHDYLPDDFFGSLEIQDNESKPGFVSSIGTVTETETQLGYDDPDQAPGTVFKMTVVLNDVPLQDQTSDHVVKARLAMKADPKGAAYGLVSTPSEVAGNSNDIVLDTSLDYITAIDVDTVDIAFGEETFERDGETVTEWVKERDIYFYAPANVDTDSAVDDFVKVTWERTETAFENTETHEIRVNEWLQTVQANLPLDGRAVAVRGSADGSVFVALEYPEEGISVVDILHFSRTGQIIATLPIRLGTSNLKLADLVIREKGIPEPTPTDPNQIQDLFVVLNVDELVASPATPGGTEGLGGQDVVVGMYRRVNYIGSFDPMWLRQLGSVWDDVATSAYLNIENKLFVTGTTTGGFGSFINSGGTDAFILLLDDSGVLENSRNYGTPGNDAFLGVTRDGTSNAFFVGYVGGETEQGAGGGGLDIVSASFSDDLTIRRINQFGGLSDQVMRATAPLNLGFFVSGTLSKQQTGVAGFQNDVVVGYQRSASQLDSYAELATEGEDMVESVTAVGARGFAAGYTEGSLFEDNEYGGGKDWWIASYDVVQPDPTDNDRVIKFAWQYQGGDSRDESIVSLTPTDYGKLYKLTEILDNDQKIIQITPFALTDGRELSVTP